MYYFFSFGHLFYFFFLFCFTFNFQYFIFVVILRIRYVTLRVLKLFMRLFTVIFINLFFKNLVTLYYLVPGEHLNIELYIRTKQIILHI